MPKLQVFIAKRRILGTKEAIYEQFRDDLDGVWSQPKGRTFSKRIGAIGVQPAQRAD
jgi:hypothetical protein